MVTTFAVLVVFAASLFISGGGVTGAAVSQISAQQAAQKTIDFINNDLMAGQATAVLINVTEESGVYAVSFDMSGTKYVAYVSKDGKYLFPQKVEITAAKPAQQAVKSAKPVVQLFVMSFCPYGQQAEAGMKPVADLLGSKVTFEPHFIISVSGTTTASLHDSASNHNAESAEDMRQAVILKHYGVSAWWTYVDYFDKNCNINTVDTCWKDAAKASSVDTTKVTGWVASEGLDLMKADAALSDQLGVTGSPTIFINGSPYGSNDRSPAAFQSSICGAFTTAPAECSQAASSNASAASGSCNT